MHLRIDYKRSASTMYPMHEMFRSFTSYEVSIHLIGVWDNTIVTNFHHTCFSYVNCLWNPFKLDKLISLLSKSISLFIIGRLLTY